MILNGVAIAVHGSGASGNQPPTVSVTSPVNNATFTAPASITIAQRREAGVDARPGETTP